MLPSLTLIGRGRLQPLAHLGHSHSSTKGYKFVPLAGHTATVIPGRKILVFGGQNTESGQLAGLWLLDTVGWEWSKPVPLGTPPAKRSGHSAIYNRDGHVYFFGGWDGIRMRNDFSVLGIQGDPPPLTPTLNPLPSADSIHSTYSFNHTAVGPWRGEPFPCCSALHLRNPTAT